MGILENFCNETIVFVPLVPPIAHRENVDASNDGSCSGIVNLCLNNMNDKISIK